MVDGGGGNTVLHQLKTAGFNWMDVSARGKIKNTDAEKTTVSGVKIYDTQRKSNEDIL